MVADRLDVVAVWIEDIGGVVVRGVLRTEAGGAVVRSSGGDGGDVERIDRRAVVGVEGDVRAATGLRRPIPKSSPFASARYASAPGSSYTTR